MFNKIYDYIKKNIKDYLFTIIFAIIIYVVFNIPVNYSIMASGGTIDINDRIIIENEYDTSGSLNLAYVSELKGTVLTYLVSYLIPSWERISLDNYKVNDDENASDIENRSIISFNSSLEYAIVNAYNKANKEVIFKDNLLYVYYIHDESKTDLKVGDKIVKIDEEKVINIDDYLSKIANYDIGDKISFEVIRNEKSIKTSATVKEIEEAKKIGIAVLNLHDFETNPSIKYEFKKSEQGPSGGLMLTLSIYNKLVEEDITKGKKIVGTGTINLDGTVGEIGGVNYKLYGAVKSKADVFLVPIGDNYDECIKLQKEKNYKIKIIGVSSFEDALEKLKNI